MKIQRKYMAHYLNAAFSDPEASYVRLGRDLEEYARNGDRRVTIKAAQLRNDAGVVGAASLGNQIGK